MNYACKISIIGNEHTGKTSLINRYINNTFSTEYKTTLGADVIDKTYSDNDFKELGKNNTISITFWDMAGQQHYFEVASLYLEGSIGILIVFDINNLQSFKDVQKWYQLAHKTCPSAEILIVGNKDDLEKKIKPEDIKEMEKKLKKSIEFTSAKTNNNVSNIFLKIVGQVLKRNMEKKQ